MVSRSLHSLGGDQISLTGNDSPQSSTFLGLHGPLGSGEPLSSKSAQRTHLQRASGWTWTLVFIPIVGNLLLSVCTVALMWFYVKGRLFNIHDRRPTFTEADGTQSSIPHFALLQTDITTILSITLSIIRSLASAWFAGACWRCAFILLEKDGMRLKDFDNIISDNFHTMFTFCLPRKNGHLHISSAFFTLIILLLALPAQYAAPLLSGSITWEPSFDRVLGKVPVSGITTTSFGPGHNAWKWYSRFAENRSNTRFKAAALASIAWSTSDANYPTSGLMKRVVLSAKNLAVNSTLANVTLPFFTVHSINWLSDVDLAAITEPDLQYAINKTQGFSSVSADANPLTAVTPTLGFIPTTPYVSPYNDITDSCPFPPPAKLVAQSNLLALFWDRQINAHADITSCPMLSAAFGPLPSNVGFKSQVAPFPEGDGINCYIFAYVTFSAGVAICNNCMLSASGGIFERNVVQLNASFEEDAMTRQAIMMTPEVITTMAIMNTSIPPTWSNLQNYTSEMLARSYAASWNVLTDTVSSSFIESWSVVPSPSSNSDLHNSLATQASIAVPSIRAVVSVWRVGLWFGLQTLLSFSGLIFIFLQRTALKPLASSPAIDAFLFDTGEIRRRKYQERGRFDTDKGHESGDGKKWSIGSDREDTGLMGKMVNHFVGEDESLMRLTREDHFSVIRYHR